MSIVDQSIYSRVPMTSWQTETLRLTAFLRPTDEVIEQNWWSDLFAEPPDATSARPKSKQKREEGQFGEGKLVLVVQPERIDWLFTTSDKEWNMGETPTVGSFPESLKEFSRLIEKWLGFNNCPPMQRLAFGAVLSLPVKSRQEGYRQISEYLPFNLDPDGSSDFMYQINRPRDSESGIAGLRVNRLSKWSVATTYWMKSQLLLGLASAVHFPGPQLHSCRLELDINTVPDFKEELAQEQLPSLFQELVNFGKEIVKRGDIR